MNKKHSLYRAAFGEHTVQFKGSNPGGDRGGLPLVFISSGFCLAAKGDPRLYV
jgi:hypothetical protein